MKRTELAGAAVMGIFVCILLIIFAPVILVLIAGCIVGAFLVYVMLLAAPASYSDGEQEITDDECLFVCDDI
ncbi:hypothetical protein [Methanogenium sp. MK-MG]|uniref:hypothetical protein n=1 Tax=Methanogenium sp. MK-MG TaxID=2599926 RepID=UPI0013EB9C24|nr:hypothetical protein [Methanogenium sp. MK-MG]KAF1078555.1 hypothetical protein MKMG_00515 [Methanogenium sp. MK-MG]